MSERGSEHSAADRHTGERPERREQWPAAAYGGGQVDASIVDYIGILQKRRVIALAAFLAVVLPVVPLVLMAPSIYEAGARLMLERVASTPMSFREGQYVEGDGQRSFETQAETLRNRTVAQKTIEQLKLWESPAFMSSNQVFSVRDAIRWASDATVGRFTAHPAPASSDRGRAEALVDLLISRVSVRPIENSRLVDIVVESRDPNLAATIANTLAQFVVEQDMESRFQSARHASEWLDKRLAEQRAVVDASEAALQQFREDHGSVSLGDRQNISVQRLADLNAALTKAKTERISKEGLYNQLVALEKDRAALDTFPAILSNAYIQQLKAQVADLQKELANLSERYGERYPDVIKVKTALEGAQSRLQVEIAKTVESVKNDYLAARSQEQNLSGALEVQKRQALDVNRVEIQYASLERDAQSNRQVLENLLQQAKQSGLAASVSASNIRVVEQAVVPAVPVRPQRGRALMLTFFGAALLSLGLAFVAEYLDTRVKSPEEIRMYLGVHCLGMMPVVGPKDLDHSVPLVGRHSSANFSEAVRRIRTSLMVASMRDSVKTLAVTSTSPEEGKTVVASNLAVVLAQAGRHVLLIDADMRRPMIHEVFGVPQQPGLSSALMHPRDSVAEIVRRDGVAGLELLTAGSTPPNPAELLAMPAFRELLDRLAPAYDHVIIDCPPVMAVTDASLVANEVSGVVFVIGAEATTRAAARTALDQLRQSRDNVVGAVLNRVDLRHNSYYYARYYRPEYERYYRRA
jgi:succinoglycan biosynthesis transport protein ExoP